MPARKSFLSIVRHFRISIMSDSSDYRIRQWNSSSKSTLWNTWNCYRENLPFQKIHLRKDCKPWNYRLSNSKNTIGNMPRWLCIICYSIRPRFRFMTFHIAMNFKNVLRNMPKLFIWRLKAEKNWQNNAWGKNSSLWIILVSLGFFRYVRAALTYAGQVGTAPLRPDLALALQESFNNELLGGILLHEQKDTQSSAEIESQAIVG